MSREEVIKRVSDIFRDIFDDEELQDVTDETTSADIEGWDSLTHISLIASIEDEFDIAFPMKEVVGFKNVGQMIDSIINHSES